MFICSHIFYGSFQNTRAELSSCDREIMTRKHNTFIICFFTEKNILTSSLAHLFNVFNKYLVST